MKFLEYTPLDSINQFLECLDLGECIIKGKLEAYSCKNAGTDRKLSLSLENEIVDYLGQSQETSPNFPMDLSSKTSRRTLVQLVLTLNHMFPDYDFSAIHSHSFLREEGSDSFEQVFETYMFDAEKVWALTAGSCSLSDSIQKAIDEVMDVNECEVYSYNQDFEGDAFFQKGALWSFNFLFYNKKLKRILSFRCCCLSKSAATDWFDDAERTPHKVDESADQDLVYDMEI